jgi:SP family galactose:H+ symporter-like MFS transporter
MADTRSTDAPQHGSSAGRSMPGGEPQDLRRMPRRDDSERTQQTSSEGQRSPITRYIYVVASLAALGGLLFGYDTGVVSGAQHYFVAEFRLDPTRQELVVSAVLVGAMIGSLIAGKMADWMGRRRWLILMAIIFAVGAVLTASSWNFASLATFRVLIGIGVGGAAVAAPLYTTERVPARVRGRLVFLFQLAITFGILVAYAIDLWFGSVGWGWRPMFAVAIVPAVALGLGMFFLSDTPRWYASKCRWNEATRAMYQASGSEAETRAEAEDIRVALEGERTSRLTDLLRPGLRIALLVGVGLAILQQFVGINTIIYYAPIVLGYSGFGMAGNSLLGALLVGIVNFLTTVVAVMLVDRVGRRPLLLGSGVGMLVTLVVVGVLFALGAREHGALLVVFVLLYIVSFAVGFGPTFWLMSSEVFPNRLRGAGESVSTLANWAANFLVSATFLSLIIGIGATFTFWIYAFFAVVTILFVWFFVPETKAKRLEQIESYWLHGRRWPAAKAA